MTIIARLKNFHYPVTVIIAASAIYANFIFYTTPKPTNVISYTDNVLYASPANLTISLTFIAFVLETVIRMMDI